MIWSHIHYFYSHFICRIRTRTRTHHTGIECTLRKINNRVCTLPAPSPSSPNLILFFRRMKFNCVYNFYSFKTIKNGYVLYILFVVYFIAGVVFRSVFFSSFLCRLNVRVGYSATCGFFICLFLNGWCKGRKEGEDCMAKSDLDMPATWNRDLCFTDNQLTTLSTSTSWQPPISIYFRISSKNNSIQFEETVLCPAWPWTIY